MLGCVKIKSRKNVDGCPVFIAIATILMISEASAQNRVKSNRKCYLCHQVKLYTYRNENY